MSILDILNSANWAKGNMANNDTPCLGIAMNKCNIVSPAQAWRDMGSIIESEYPERAAEFVGWNLGSIVNFNDHPETTWEDIERVVQKFEANQ